MLMVKIIHFYVYDKPYTLAFLSDMLASSYPYQAQAVKAAHKSLSVTAKLFPSY